MLCAGRGGGGPVKVAQAKQLSIVKVQGEGGREAGGAAVLAAIGARALISLTRPTLRKVATAAH